MLESQIEKKFVQKIKQLGGAAYKFVSPGNVGVPDRLCITPQGKIIFVELKTETGKLSQLQTVQIAKLQKLGQEVRVLYGWAEVEAFLNAL